MIAYLNGVLVRVEADYVVVDVHGVGYKVFVPFTVSAQLPQIGNAIQLQITTIVREDSISFYGFSDEDQQSMFELLTTVSGVGPRLALNILSVLTVEQIVSSISGERFYELNVVPGVGTKTAQRIVIELREKVSALSLMHSNRMAVSDEQRSLDDTVEGLVALGYSRNDARNAAEKAMKCVENRTNTAGILTEALKHLGKR